MSILLADIGGTNSRFALAGADGRLERVLLIRNDTVADLEAAIARYVEETGARPQAATIAIAGPVDEEVIALTNRPWRVLRSDIATRFGFSQLHVLNDFEAIAWALPRLSAADTPLLGPTLMPRAGVRIVVGPSTGLGVAALFQVGGRCHTLASEGGHASFGPRGKNEVEIFKRLFDEAQPLSAESVISGPGLLRLTRALVPQGNWRNPEAVVANALAGDPSALAASRLFVELLGRFAGDMALTFKALGGVYISGTVAIALRPVLEEPPFRAAFEAHPPHERLLAAIPTLLVTARNPVLIGCAAYANMRLAVPALTGRPA